ASRPAPASAALRVTGSVSIVGGDVALPFVGAAGSRSRVVLMGSASAGVHAGRQGRGSTPIGPLVPSCHNGGMPVRVFLLDDHELVRRGIRDLLWAEDDLSVVGEAATADEALEKIPQTSPDVAV